MPITLYQYTNTYTYTYAQYLPLPLPLPIPLPIPLLQMCIYLPPSMHYAYKNVYLTPPPPTPHPNTPPPSVPFRGGRVDVTADSEALNPTPDYMQMRLTPNCDGYCIHLLRDTLQVG
jgi:hypothetical protein